MKFKICENPSLVIITLNLICLIHAPERKRRREEILHFHYMTYMVTPQHKNPYSGGHEFYYLGRPFLVHHYYTLSLFDLYLGEEKIFKEIMHFHHVTN